MDRELTRRGHHFVRYADDCNIYVKTQRAGKRVMKSITRFLERQLKVKVNPDKSKVGSPLRLKFLDFSLGVDSNGAFARPAKEVQKQVKQALRIITKRNRGIPLAKMCTEINRKVRGWIQYIWKQWKKFKTRVTNLKKLGLSHHKAYKLASIRKGYWRIAHGQVLTYSLTNRKLECLGLMNLSKTLQSIQSD